MKSLALTLFLLNCSRICVSTSFVAESIRFHPQSPNEEKTRTRSTRRWGKYSRNTPKKTKINKDDLLSYERSLVTDKGYSNVLGSDETGRGSIAGPVVTVSCCILTLKDSESGEIVDPSELPTAGLLPPPNNNNNNNSLIRDSKQLCPKDRELIYEAIVDNPQVYAFSVAQRSNTEIDATGNILASTMDAFKESIEDLAETKVFPHALSKQEGSVADADRGCYGIVDGKKAPKLSLLPSFPCRPMVKADQQVYTVALASIIAKVTLDRMFLEWHEEYPNYGFDQNLGYATKEHIEAIHKYGPCPLHRMTFKSLKGR